MGILNDILRGLGVAGSKKSRRSSGAGLPTLPDPSEIKESVETIVESITNLKDLPKSLISKISEADSDFREADKTFRSTRVKGKKR